MEIKGYLRLFQTHADYENYMNSDDVVYPNVAYCLAENHLHYNSEPDYLSMPLTFEIISGGTLYWYATDDRYTKTIEYRKNDGEWNSVTSSHADYGSMISVVEAGDIIELRGDNEEYSNGYGNLFRCSNGLRFSALGNIMSLVNSTSYSTLNTLSQPFTFGSLFCDVKGLVSAKNLKLPALNLTDFCYNEMFCECENLLYGPCLPSTTLSKGCYFGMFRECPNLVEAPELPSKVLYERCYTYMFHGCRSLIETPTLIASILSEDCYRHMFTNCNNLSLIRCYATNIASVNCTMFWCNGVSSTGTFIKHPEMNDWTIGEDGIPQDWTIENAIIN